MTAVQQAVQPICKVLIQGQVNALGVGAIAAFNAVSRVDDFACIPEQSIATAITTYIAQNRGAGRPPASAAALRWPAVGAGLLAADGQPHAAAASGHPVPVCGREGAADVIALGSTYLSWMAVLRPARADNGFQGFYRGMGKMTTPLIGTCLQAGLRAAAAAVLAPAGGPAPASLCLCLRLVRHAGV